MRIDENIGVNQYHLWASPSAMVRASPMLSTPAIRSWPSATDLVRKRSRRLVRLLISFKPRRSASLIKFFKLALRVLRNRSSGSRYVVFQRQGRPHASKHKAVDVLKQEFAMCRSQRLEVGR